MKQTGREGVAIGQATLSPLTDAEPSYELTPFARVVDLSFALTAVE